MSEPVKPAASIDIINSALFKLGVEPITDIDEEKRAARLAKATYAQIRNDVLAAYPWRFATLRRELSLATLPDGVWGFDRAYELARETYLAVWSVENQSAQTGEDWEIDGDLLLTNLGSGTEALKTKLIVEITEVPKYSPGFVEHLTERLQAEWCEPLRRVTNLAELKLTVSEAKGRSAMSREGQQGTPKRITAQTFTRVR